MPRLLRALLVSSSEMAIWVFGGRVVMSSIDWSPLVLVVAGVCKRIAALVGRLECVNCFIFMALKICLAKMYANVTDKNMPA